MSIRIALLIAGGALIAAAVSTAAETAFANWKGSKDKKDDDDDSRKGPPPRLSAPTGPEPHKDTFTAAFLKQNPAAYIRKFAALSPR